MPHLARKSFAADLLNSLTAHIAVLNSQGEIIAVNNAWKQFGRENNCPDRRSYVGTNYLRVCEEALKRDHDESVEEAYRGIQAVLLNEKQEFLLEYPCNSPTEERWFTLRSTRFEYEDQTYVVTSHENITTHKKTQTTLAESHERFRLLTHSLPDTIYTLDIASRRVNYFNRDSFLGYSRDELMAPGSIMQHLHPEDVDSVQIHWRRVFEGKAPDNIEYRVRSKTGQWEWVDSRQIILTANMDGSPSEIMVILRLITDRKQADEQIAYQAELLNNVNDIIFGTDENFRIKYWNQAAERSLGWKAEEVMGHPADEILRPRFAEGTYEDVRQLLLETGFWKGEVTQTTKDGRPLTVDANIMLVRNHTGQVTGYVSTNRDITEKKQAQDKLAGAYQALEMKNRELQQAIEREQRLARTDGLTGIYNHRHFIDIASFEFAMAQRYKHRISIMIFDIDMFKHVNDTMGHLFGDEVLKQIAQIAKVRLRETDVLARYGGEEFIVLLPNTNTEETRIVAEAVRKSIEAKTFDTEKGHIRVTISIGIAEFLPEEDSLEKLIRRADSALYKAKAAGRNCVRVWSAGSVQRFTASTENLPL